MKINLLFFILLLLTNIIFSNDNGLTFSGNFKTSTSMNLKFISNDQLNYFYLGKSCLRLNIINNDHEFAKLDGSFDINIYYGYLNYIYTLQSNGILIGNDALLNLDVRKLYLNIKTDYLNFYIGRQLLKFGEGVVFSPANPFSYVDLTDISFTRIGVNCLRLKYYILDPVFIELITIPSIDLTNSDIIGRFGFNIFGWDINIISFYRGKYDNISVGYSFKGDLLFGLYGEYIYNFSFTNDNYWNIMLGLDYSLFDNILFRIEYYYHTYNTNLHNIVEIVNSQIYPFVSKQYLMGQIIYSPTLIDSIYLSYIDNLENNAFLLNFSYLRNLYQNLDFIFNILFQYNDLTGLNIIRDSNLLINLEFTIKF